jgi:hypothetical protein
MRLKPRRETRFLGKTQPALDTLQGWGTSIPLFRVATFKDEAIDDLQQFGSQQVTRRHDLHGDVGTQTYTLIVA